MTYLAGSFLSTCRQLGIAEFELNGGLARLNTLSDKPVCTLFLMCCLCAVVFITIAYYSTHLFLW